MTIPHTPSLTIEFLESQPDGLRLVTQSNWSIRVLLSSRARLAATLGKEESRQHLDVPGVYLLTGSPENPVENSQKEIQVYIGQGDSVADRLETHLKSEAKRWWRSVLVVRRDTDNPLNLSQCRFLESSLYSRALDANLCALANKVAPQPPFLAPNEQSSIQDFLEKALLILSALGLNIFETPITSEPPPPEAPLFIPPPPNLQPLVEQIRKTVTGESFPRAEWYSTFSPDYRAKVVNDSGDFRVFVRVKWAKNWLWLQLPKLGKYKIVKTTDVDASLHKEIAASYKRAGQYLERGK